MTSPYAIGRFYAVKTAGLTSGLTRPLAQRIESALVRRGLEGPAMHAVEYGLSGVRGGVGGAALGAVGGAVHSDRDHRGEGALRGAITGGVLGTATGLAGRAAYGRANTLHDRATLLRGEGHELDRIAGKIQSDNAMLRDVSVFHPGEESWLQSMSHDRSLAGVTARAQARRLEGVASNSDLIAEGAGYIGGGGAGLLSNRRELTPSEKLHKLKRALRLKLNP